MGYIDLPDDTAFIIHSYEMPEHNKPIVMKGILGAQQTVFDPTQPMSERNCRVVLETTNEKETGCKRILELGGIIEGKSPDRPFDTIERVEVISSSELIRASLAN